VLEDMKKELEGIGDKYSENGDDDKSSTGRMVSDALGKNKKDEFKINVVKNVNTSKNSDTENRAYTTSSGKKK